MTISATIQAELDAPLPVTEAQTSFFRDRGFIKLKQVLSPELLQALERDVTEQVMRLYDPEAVKGPNEDTDAYVRAFKQIQNLWTESDSLRRFVFCRRLAQAAADLMGVQGVRLYHDQALYKAERGGITPWHADQFYWPLSNENTCTVWIPFQDTSVEMGALGFSEQSHKFDLGRSLPISEESEHIVNRQLEEKCLNYFCEAFDLGDISYHYGWTFHNTAENSTDLPRKAMTIIYMEDGIKLIEPAHANHQADWDKWMPDAKIGEVVDTPLNPVLFSHQA